MGEERLGKYRLLQVLATGGMGEVFLARMEGPAGFARTVVVKRVLTALAKDPGFVEMFLNEARVAAQLSHPNIVQIVELGEEAGTYFLAMEYVHGRSLKGLRQEAAARNDRMPPVVAARVMIQVLHGLQCAHSALSDEGRPLNLIHRDVSPDNVMVGFNGVVKVLDFGIAKVADAVSTTRTGTVKGKYAYMAPEALLAEKLDSRADIYSAGVVLYELLSGQRPFTAPSEAALIRQILDTPLPPLAEKAPNVSPELRAIVNRAVEKHRQARFATAEEFAQALEAWVASLPNEERTLSITGYMRTQFASTTGEFPVVVTPSGRKPAATPGPEAPGPEAPSPRSIDVTLTGASSRASQRWLPLAIAVAIATVMAGLALSFAQRPQVPLRPVEEVRKTEVQAPPDAGAITLAVPIDEPASAGVDAGTPSASAPPPKPKGKGKLDLRVKPWGEVFVGTKSLGTTPFAPVELPAGKYTLTIKNPKLAKARSVAVSVEPGKTTSVRVDLTE